MWVNDGESGGRKLAINAGLQLAEKLIALKVLLLCHWRKADCFERTRP
jgi:hypothetical protein